MEPLPALHDETLNYLRKSKNLLAFSGGIDSSALFFLLMQNGIFFDIAIVNYNTRKQSQEEVDYAKELAQTYNKQCYVLECKLPSSNFEHIARETRYNFFKTIMTDKKYQTLISAHHLNDKFEWFLMQLGKGSGLVEMIGMNEFEKMENFNIVRPLLHVSKKSLLDYLKHAQRRYFVDESNTSEHHFRNRIRKNYANDFVQEFEDGLKQSFEYLHEDCKRLLPNNTERIKDLFIIKKDKDELINIRQIDKAVKMLGKILSKESRKEILRTKDCVVCFTIAIAYAQESIFVCPYVTYVMDKPFKELCRHLKIPAKIRPYICLAGIEPQKLVFKS
ncbi:MAG: tRNA lysidine(34) synthetase TilS [Sulfurospirillaceae bacterium]|nr:tRNA lysidine(34) synthetase TilS [Sulfurospirillaceae bacterium]MDD3462243.1 tRNA lysidine(34) synthetase TilS [Sulfurospirillaceae bacterium]